MGYGMDKLGVDKLFRITLYNFLGNEKLTL